MEELIKLITVVFFSSEEKGIIWRTEESLDFTFPFSLNSAARSLSKDQRKKVNRLSFESELLPTLNSQSWRFWHLL